MRLAGIVLPLLLLAPTASASPSSAVISRAACARLVPHRPAPDVAYRPGVDAHGRAVAPADIGAPPLDLPLEVGVDIVVPWPERFRQPGAPPALYRGEIYAGLVVLAPDGTVLFNGRPLTDPEQDYLAYLCREAGQR